MTMSLAAEVKSSLAALGVQARKKWGQNFMVSETALAKIADSLKLTAHDTVLEIGPGLGFLTRELLRRAGKVAAIEKDPLMVQRLRNLYPGLAVIEEDVLKLDWTKEFKVKKPIKVAGNIPYNITTPILERLIENRVLVSEAVLTVQWEVAERLTAKPGTKAWGSLSIYAQVYARMELVQKIGKHSFVPVPKVDSASILFKFSERPLWPIGDEKAFFALVRRAFRQRRKTLLNALLPDKHSTQKASILEALSGLGISPYRRAETLSIDDWVTMIHHLHF